MFQSLLPIKQTSACSKFHNKKNYFFSLSQVLNQKSQRFLRVSAKTPLNEYPSDSIKKYYEELLNQEYVDEDGYLQVDPMHLTYMIDIIKTQDDLETAIEQEILSVLLSNI